MKNLNNVRVPVIIHKFKQIVDLTNKLPQVHSKILPLLQVMWTVQTI